jgi:hypothetical protein
MDRALLDTDILSEILNQHIHTLGYGLKLDNWRK